MTAAPPEACDPCLRRAWLLADLAGHIERVATHSPGRRARELLALSDQDLVRALARGRAEELLEDSARRRADELRERIAAAGAWACCRHDPRYPGALRGDSQAPTVLLGRGEHALLARLGEAGDAVTVVGSRRPSSYGRQLAASLGRELAASGLAVVSGMALGIDSSAHSGALEASGLTVAVLGSGPDVPYPPRHRRLYETIVERGMVLSELPPGTEPRRWTFPARNRIMAALSAMTVVVEAKQRSGSLITAAMATDLGREVGAVPGRVGNSAAAGTNALLRDGAQVVRGAQDVLDSLLGAGMLRRRPQGAAVGSAAGPSLEPELALVLELIEAGAPGADAIATRGRLDPGEAAAALARLELMGYVRCDSAGRPERTTLGAPP